MSRKQKVTGTAATVALLVVGLAIGVVASSGKEKEPCVKVASTTSFDDVTNPDDRTAVSDVVSKGMMQGCGATYFCPGEFVPREDLAVALVRGMHGSTFAPAQPTAPPASDVTATYCLAGFIKQWLDDGVVQQHGCAAGSFCPFRPVTRAQAVELIARARDWRTNCAPAGPPTDPPPTRPDDPVTRVELAQWLSAVSAFTGNPPTCPTPPPTSTATRTPTGTATATATRTSTAGPTVTRTPTGAATATRTVTAAPTSTATRTATGVPTALPTATPTRTASPTATPIPGTPTITPTPAPTQHQLVIGNFPLGGGSIDYTVDVPVNGSNPEGLICTGATCTYYPSDGSEVTLTANAKSSYAFSHWSPNPGSGAFPCSTPSANPCVFFIHEPSGALANYATVTPTPTATPTTTVTPTRTATAAATSTATFTPAPTLTPTRTPVAPTPTSTATPIPTLTPTPTRTTTPASTPTAVVATPTRTATPAPTSTGTPTRTATPASTPTAAAPTPTQTATPAPTLTRTPTKTMTPLSTPTPASTQTPTPASTQTATPAPTLTRTPTRTATPASTPTAVVATPTRTATPAPTSTRTPTRTATPVSTATPTPSQTATPAPTLTRTPTRTTTPASTPTVVAPTPTRTATPVATLTPTPTRTATPVSTATPTPSRTATPAPTLTRTPTATPTATPAPTPTPLPYPADLFATRGDYTDRVMLTWSSVPGATSYKLYRRNGTVPQSLLVTQAGTDYDDYAVVRPTSYYYAVSACNASGCSPQSPEVLGYVNRS